MKTFRFYMATEMPPQTGHMVSLVGLYDALGVQIMVEVGETFPEHESLSATILETTHGPVFPKGSTVTVVRDHTAVTITQD